jgi:hypothetical protein
MSTLRTAAQQALEALEGIADELISPYNDPIGKAILDLRTALAEPEQEPVAHLWQHCDTGRTRVVMPDQIITADANWLVVGPLYLHPPQRKPLTDEEILLDEVLRYHFGCNGGAGPVSQKGIKVIRAVERAHGIGGAP